MVDGWQWDRTLFQGSAAYYEQGRLPYAPGWVEQLAAALDLDGRGRLLDVGCGPGTVTVPLASRFDAAVGLDPDLDMLARAQRCAMEQGVPNVRWVAARAEELPAGLGRFTVVSFAQSFHWTDRNTVAKIVFRMLEPAGAVVHISDCKEPPLAGPVPLQAPAPPRAEMADLVRRHLGPQRRAGQGVLPNGTPGREDLVVERAGFVDLRRLIVPAGGVVGRSVDDLVGWVFSRSASAPHLFGRRLGDFERDLRALLTGTSADGRFAEQLPDTEIMIWRKPSAG
jgi:SAM-dependent methyltransferase